MVDVISSVILESIKVKRIVILCELCETFVYFVVKFLMGYSRLTTKSTKGSTKSTEGKLKKLRITN